MRVVGLILYLFLSICSNGQIDTLYLTSEYEFTDIPNQVTYLRVIESKNADNTTKVVDFLRTGKKYFDGSVVFLNSILPTHSYTFFYPNGKIRCSGTMDNIIAKTFKGFTEITYYLNGKIRSKQSIVNGEERILEAYDSLGNPTILSGNGNASIEVFYYHMIWSGKIKNFQRDSIWTGVDTRTGKLLHTEKYRKGDFISGKTWTKDGYISYKVISKVSSKYISKIRKHIRREIATHKFKEEPIVALLIKNGKIVEIQHLIRDTNDQKIIFDKIAIPPEFIFYQRGLPIEHLTLEINR